MTDRHPAPDELEPSYVESARRSGGWERAEHRAVLPGKHGLECSVYQYLQYKTMHLRREVYVTFATEGVEFRPATNEHIPHGELIRYQMKNVFTGEQSYGEGRSLEVVFACYCPEGSGAADLAVSAIRGALEELRDVARLSEWERSQFGVRYGMKSALIKMREHGTRCYRPPEGALPYRTGPPASTLFSRMSFSKRVDALLSSWGHKDLADEMRRKREEASRERRALRLLERQELNAKRVEYHAGQAESHARISEDYERRAEELCKEGPA